MNRYSHLDRPKPRRSAFPIIGGVVVALLVGAAILFFGVGSSFLNEQTRSCTVTDKDRSVTMNVTDGNGQSQTSMRVYTKECDVLTVEDKPLRGVWDSASLYGSLEVGKTYQVTTVWYRIPFLSWFPSVIKVS